MEVDNKIEPQPMAETETEYVTSKQVFTKDEYHLATLGYKQEFFRGLGLFENW
jgi:hypothetical protein